MDFLRELREMNEAERLVLLDYFKQAVQERKSVLEAIRQVQQDRQEVLAGLRLLPGLAERLERATAEWRESRAEWREQMRKNREEWQEMRKQWTPVKNLIDRINNALASFHKMLWLIIGAIILMMVVAGIIYSVFMKIWSWIIQLPMKLVGKFWGA